MRLPKIFRNTCYGLLVIAVLGFVLHLYINHKVREIFSEQIALATNNEYELSTHHLSFNLFTQTLFIKDFTISPSKKLSKSKTHYVIKAKSLKISGISIAAYFKEHNLFIGGIDFDQPQISLYQNIEIISNKQSKKNHLKISTDFNFANKLNLLSIGYIDIKNYKFRICKNEKDLLSLFTTNNNKIHLEHLTINFINSQNLKTPSESKYELLLKSFSYKSDKGMYTLSGKMVYASTHDSILLIDSLKLTPNYSKENFAKTFGWQTTRTEFTSGKVIFNKVDYNLLYTQKKLNIHKVELLGGYMDIFRDNRLPLAPITKPSPQAIIKQLPVYVSVDTIVMKQARLKYSILNSNSDSLGRLSINKMNIIVTGLKNDTTRYNDNSNMNIYANGTIGNKGLFYGSYIFPLKSVKENFYCSGIITSMPLSVFNSLIKPTKHISIKSGRLNYLNFYFSANDSISSGVMNFNYSGLKIEVLNKRDKKAGLKEMFKTLFANKFKVRSDNPDKSGIFQVYKIELKHNPYRYFINYSMQSILNGVESAVFIKKKPKKQK